MLGVIKKIFGTQNERELKRISPMVERINALEPAISALSDAALRDKTDELRSRLTAGETLDDIIFEAFALVRETAWRILKMRHFDVQLVGGIVLHQGKIAEMKTGEGKTLVATLPVYLNALDGRGAHVITVNDYLAKRDAQWMGPVYHHLGLSVGVIQHDASFLFDPDTHSEDKSYEHFKPCSRQEAYGADITYGTNNEFGFDYLRDNMKYEIADYCQRELNYAIVDEVDSILIDESRTPLIISGPSEESTGKYYKIDKSIPKLKRETDFTIDEKAKTAILTEDGCIKAEELLGVENLFDPVHIELVHHILQGLKAHHLFRRDVDYVVKDGQIVIVDEFTGRLMPGRRWSDGLHQAIEAMEGVKIESENQTLATITFQNYFRMYNKLSGMTGTADTEAAEFASTYNIDVMVIPTNKPMLRADNPDVIYKTERAKFDAVINDIVDCNRRGQPVLVGTISIERSELLGRMLKKKGVEHSVLNAKYHEKEAGIIAQAGRPGAVTIATNMAGRGTDIVLGGNPEGLAEEALIRKKEPSEEERGVALKEAVERCDEGRKGILDAGGLYILGTERHESRRIDNQLRGRSGRQGDPGSSRFFLSLEDDLMRIFGSDKISGLMGKLGMEEDVPIENRMVSKAIQNAQKRVEAHNFEIRKHLLDYDDVMNKQRTEIYSFRREILEEESLKPNMEEMIEDIGEAVIDMYISEDIHPEEWDTGELSNSLYGIFDYRPDDLSGIRGIDALRETVIDGLKERYNRKEQEIGVEFMRYLEKVVMLQIVDEQWKDHLLAMDHLKEGIGLRGYGQKDPLVEYKREAFDMFSAMTDRIKTEILTRMYKVQVKTEEEAARVSHHQQQDLVFSHGESESDAARQPVKRSKKVGRNEPCPCGSGKKYKKCCGMG